MSRVYIAGPMSGWPELNYPAFHAMAAQLRAAGHHVENPAENHPPHCQSWLGYMRLAVAQLATCDAVIMLPGWRQSRGAIVEHQLATGMGLQVMDDTPAPRTYRGRTDLELIDTGEFKVGGSC